MRFYTLKERMPIEGQTVLAKLSEHSGCVEYYVLDYVTAWDWEIDKGKLFHFVEADGERYMTIDDEDIIGWMPIENLDEIRVGE